VAAEPQLRDCEHGSAVDDGESGESDQIPRLFFHRLDGDSGPLEYFGRESLSFFRSLLEAGGCLPPKTWQEFNQAHLTMIIKFLSHCLDAWDTGSSALVGPPNWRSILKGQPDPQLTFFMVDTLHAAVGSTRLSSRGWEQGKSSPYLKVDIRKVDSTLLVGPDELERLRRARVSSMPLIVVGGAAVEHGLAQRSALLMVDEDTSRLVHFYPCNPNRSQWVSKIKAGCGVDCNQGNSRIDEKVRQPVAEFLQKAGLMTAGGRFQHSREPALLQKNQESAAFVRFIQLVQVLTGEEVAADRWDLCVKVQRLWWVLQLLRVAERSGAIPAGWLRAHLDAEIKASKAKINKLLAEHLDKRGDVTDQPEGSCAPAAPDSIPPNMEPHTCCRNIRHSSAVLPHFLFNSFHCSPHLQNFL
jgi:hypothetical protein